MFKKLVSLMLVGMMAFTVPVSASESEEEKIVLDFPSWQAAEAGFAEFWEDAIGRYEEEHPNVEINLYQVPYSGYVDTLITRFSGGNPPDICHIPAFEFNAFQREGWFENLDSRFEGTDIPETWTPLQSSVCGEDGGNYGLLLMGYGQVLFYNEKLLNEAGVAVPTTLDELVDAARTLTKDTDDDGVVDQFGYVAGTTTDSSLLSCVAPFVVGNGTHWATGEQLNVDDPKVMEGLEKFKTLYTENLMPLGVSIEQARSYFIEGKAAMYMEGSFFWSAATQAAEGVVEYLKVAPTPTNNAVGSPSNSIHIPASISEDRKELVWEFIELLASDEYQVKYAEYTKSPAPKSTAMTEELAANNPEIELFAEQAAVATDQRPEAFIPVYTEFTNIMVDELMAYCMDPEMTAAECLANMDEAIKYDIVW